MPKSFSKSCNMTLFTYEDITLSKIRWPVGMGSWAWLGDLNEWSSLILISIPIRFGGCNFFQSCTKEFLICQVITWLGQMLDYLTLKNGNASLWNVFPLSFVILVFVKVPIWRFQFVKQWRDQRSCHRYVGYYFILFTNLVDRSFLKLWHDNMENWYYNMY